MTYIEAKFTVFFEEPFWVGVYERSVDGFLEVSKITFGTEPKDYDIYNYILLNFNKLKFSKPIKKDKVTIDKKINPKRMQRLISNQLDSSISTKSQQALKLQHEQNKLENKSLNRVKKEEQKQKQFELKQQKKKQKHRGR